MTSQMKISFDEVYNLSIQIFNKIAIYLEFSQDEDTFFVREDIEVLDNLRMALKDFTLLSWIYFPFETFEKVKTFTDINKISYFFSYLLDVQESRIIHVKLPTKLYFEDFKWVDEYNRVAKYFRRSGWRKRKLLKKDRDKNLPKLKSKIKDQIKELSEENHLNDLSRDDLAFYLSLLIEYVMEIEDYLNSEFYKLAEQLLMIAEDGSYEDIVEYGENELEIKKRLQRSTDDFVSMLFDI